MLIRCLVLPFLFVLVATSIAGCAGTHQTAPEPKTQVRPDQTPTTDPGFRLPLPSTLEGLEDVPRTAAYTEADLVKDAAEYNSAWPWNNTAPLGNQIVFSPDWTGPGNSDGSDLAYCMYEFVVAGYDRNPQIRYTWVAQPVDPAEVWIAMANWDKNIWDWFAGSAQGTLTLRSLAPYFNASDTLVLVILRIGSEPSTLSKVRLGGSPPYAELSTTATKGIVPLTVDFDGSGSVDEDGTIVKYEWDFDGDGSFEVDSGDDPTQSHSYSSGIQANATMRVTDNQGLTSTDGVSVVAIEQGAHTWGGGESESIRDFVMTSSHLYCVGYTASYVGDNTEPLLLLKYTLTGELVWAKAFRGTNSDIGTAVAIASDGNIITAGMSRSWGSGSSDMLAQKWTPEGGLLWSRVYGGGGSEQALAIAVDGPDIYLAGYTGTEAYSAGMADVLALKLDANGHVQWARTWGGSEEDFARDIKRVPTLGGFHSFRMTGDTASFGEGGLDVIYLTISGSGDISDQYTWGDSYDQAGNAIRVGYLGADPYICGYTTKASDKKVLLLEFDIDMGFASKYWDRPGIHEAKDIYYNGEDFYLIGRFKQESAAIANGFLMLVDGTTWNMNSMHYSNQTLGVEFRKLGLFAGGEGLFICGDMDDSAGSVSATFNDPASDATAADWQVVEGTTDSISLATENTNGAHIDTVTTAIIDTGGGERDAAMVLMGL